MTLFPWKLKHVKKGDGMGVAKMSGRVHIRRGAAAFRWGQCREQVPQLNMPSSSAANRPLSETDSSRAVSVFLLSSLPLFLCCCLLFCLFIFFVLTKSSLTRRTLSSVFNYSLFQETASLAQTLHTHTHNNNNTHTLICTGSHTPFWVCIYFHLIPRKNSPFQQ